jgi:hypothetical protein
MNVAIHLERLSTADFGFKKAKVSGGTALHAGKDFAVSPKMFPS